MNSQLHNTLDALCADFEEKSKDALGDASLSQLIDAIKMASGQLAAGKSLQLSVSLCLLDDEGAWLDLAETSLSCDHRGRQELICLGLEVRSFVVRGGVRKAPLGLCPNCWRPWVPPLTLDHDAAEERACVCCGVEIGRDVKWLLEPSPCPNCVLGEVSREEPVCAICGLDADGPLFEWAS